MNLTTEQYARVKATFTAARELAEPARGDLLAALDDPIVRREVEAMLVADTSAGDRLRAPADARLARLGAERGWRIAEEIGRGGMGVVYRAERSDGVVRMNGALKHFDRLAAPADAARRLEAERQILATLDHPNISRLLDGGTAPDGSPYLVMELVDGETITHWCDRRALDLRARIALFLDVCAAVSHAHSHLVVHRDIKPANILVTTGGTVKLLDFGIAKPLGDTLGAETAPSERLLTPRYAAPEQLRGQTVSTATDVYALGVLLYELLAGTSPHGKAALDPIALLRRVSEGEPDPPSKLAYAPRLARQLVGDLDAICAKALRSEPSQRYASAEALADDLRRYLVGEPVLARRGTSIYRARKFARRHWIVLTATALIAASTVAFLLRLDLELERTRIERDKARSTASFLTTMFAAANPDQQPTPDMRLRDVLDLGTAKLEAQTDLPDAVKAALHSSIGEAYTTLNLFDGAGRHLERAVALYDALPDAPPQEHAEALHRLASLRAETDAKERAEELTRRALDIAKLAPDMPQEHVAAMHTTLATITERLGKLDTSRAEFDRALAILARLPQREAQYATTLAYYGQLLTVQRSYEAAERVLLESLDRGRRAHGGKDHSEIAHAAFALGSLFLAQRRYDEAEGRFTEALAMQHRLFGDRHVTIANIVNALGNLEYVRGRLEAAEFYQREAVAIEQAMSGEGRQNLAVVRINLARTLVDRGAAGEALTEAEAALAWRKQHMPAEHPMRLYAEAAVGHARCAAGEMEAGLAQLEAATVSLAASADLRATQSQAWYGLCLRRAGRDTEARAPLEAARVAFAERYGAQTHPVEQLDVALAGGE